MMGKSERNPINYLKTIRTHPPPPKSIWGRGAEPLLPPKFLYKEMGKSFNARHSIESFILVEQGKNVLHRFNLKKHHGSDIWL
jgi:hypothetical protein